MSFNIYPFFIHSFRKQALAAKAEAEKEGIVVPLTLEDYCIKPKSKPSNQDPPVSISMMFCISKNSYAKFIAYRMLNHIA